VLSPTVTTLRLFLHVLAATVWVGGQFALAGIVPTLRAAAPNATRSVARAFARLAWPSFAVLVVTGIWNLVEVDITDTDTAYQITVFVKVALAIASGAFTLVHQLSRTKVALAVGGALGAVTALAALFLGVLLRTGTA
jgi:putative copper export protein